MPTGLGLRMYVDSLMRTRTPSPRQRDGIDTALRDAGPTPLEIVRAAARHLAETCHLAAVTRAPRLETRRLIGLRLLRLGAGRVMALLVFDDESVNHHTFASSSPDAVLERVMSMFHAEFVGLTLSASRARLKSDVEGLDLESRELAASALAETDSDTAEQAVVVEGRTNLVECAPDGLPLGEVLRSLEDKRLLLHVLDDMLAQQGPQVVLGTESRDLGLERCTVVAAPYFVGGARAGAVALLGPLRLEYARLVPLVNYTADSISGMLRGVPSAA